MVRQPRRSRFPRRDPRLHGAPGRGARRRGQDLGGVLERLRQARGVSRERRRAPPRTKRCSSDFACGASSSCTRRWTLASRHHPRRQGRARDQLKFDTEGAVMMLENLSRMIDVERAEVRGARRLRSRDGLRCGTAKASRPSTSARIAVIGGDGARRRRCQHSESTRPCASEPETLRALARDRVAKALVAAAAGGRHAAVDQLLAAASSTWRGGRPAVHRGDWRAHRGREGADRPRATVRPGGRRAVTWPRSTGHLDFAKALAAAGATVDLANNERGHAAVVAAQNHLEVVARCRSTRARVSTRRTTTGARRVSRRWRGASRPCGR